MAEVILKNINKIYDNNVQAVFDFNLTVKDREFIIFVGPSGCGKTTTLRMIAGLEDITSGELYIDGLLANDVPPKDRNIAMVFQSYALYPHMTVFDNMAFGLKIRRMPKKEIKERVHEAAKILEIEQYLSRKPKALSGGQRQRVALGRAIVRNAKVFLMDEPLSNLDAKLRVQMRAEIIRLHERLNATTIYVTHDQTEAMTMATRIVVMKDGYIQQIGSPIEIYQNPSNLFVASFIGSPAMNLIDVIYKDGNLILANKHKISLPSALDKQMKGYNGKDVVLGIRPEDVRGEDETLEKKYPDAAFTSQIKVAELLGHEYILHTDLANTNLISKIPAIKPHSIGEKVKVIINMGNAHIFDKETTDLIV
jgi:multiple sugar transport system ATP-binding protein